VAPALGHDVLLTTDRHPAYRRFATLHGITHDTIHASAGELARGAIHVQNGNAYHSRQAASCTTFRGVATWYLDNDCGWRRAIDGSSSNNARINSPQEFLRAAVGIFRS